MPHALDFKVVFNASPNAYLLVAPDLSIVEINPTCLRIFSAARSDVIGRNAPALLGGELAENNSEFLMLLRTSYDRAFAQRAVETVPLFKRPIPISGIHGQSCIDHYLRLIHTPVAGAQEDRLLVCTFVADMTVDTKAKNEAHSPAPGKLASTPAPAGSSSATDAAQALPGRQPVSESSSLRILLVEDNEDLRESTGQLLEQMGHAVVAVSNAEDALRSLEKESFDVLFSDLTLPKMTGKELAAEVSTRYPQTRIIITSGYGRAMADMHTPNVVMLPKPYRISDLAEALR